MFLSCEVLSLDQDDTKVTLRAQDRTIEARYAVGCDGGRSLVRQTIGSAHDDLGLHQPWLVVDAIRYLYGRAATMADLARPIKGIPRV